MILTGERVILRPGTDDDVAPLLPHYSRTNRYDLAWILRNLMGPNPLWPRPGLRPDGRPDTRRDGVLVRHDLMGDVGRPA